jgi:hypothetical protein
MFRFLPLCRPRFEPLQEYSLVKLVLERLSPVDKHHGNFLAVLRVRSAVIENIYFPKLERLHGAKFTELRFHRIAQTTPGLGVEYNLNHRRLKGF